MIGSLIYRCSWSSVIRCCQSRPAASSLPPCWGPGLWSCWRVAGLLRRFPAPSLWFTPNTKSWSPHQLLPLEFLLHCCPPDLFLPSVLPPGRPPEVSIRPVPLPSGWVLWFPCSRVISKPPTLLTLLSWCRPFLLSPLVFPSLLAFLFSSVIF